MEQLKRENERLRALVKALQDQNDKAIEELRTLRAAFETYVASTTGSSHPPGPGAPAPP